MLSIATIVRVVHRMCSGLPALVTDHEYQRCCTQCNILHPRPERSGADAGDDRHRGVLSGAFVLAWAIAGMCLVWTATAFAAPARGAIALWAVVIVLGVVANVAVILGNFRRENWAPWIVVMQSPVPRNA